MESKIIRITGAEREVTLQAIKQIMKTCTPLSKEAMTLTKLYAKIKEEE